MPYSTGNIIDRTMNQDLKELLAEFSKIIDNLTDFGAKIHFWDIEKGGGDEKIPGNMFLRNFLETIDAISILVKHSSIEPCNAQLRIALETIFQIEYLLQQNQEQRALAFLVWNSKEQQKWVERCDGYSPRYLDLVKKFANDKFLNHSKPSVLPINDVLKERSRNFLALPQYRPIVAEYERTIQLGNKNPTWYALFNGPRNIEGLAKAVQMEATYEVLYRSWSKSSHGQDILQGKLSASAKDESGKSTGLIDGIRSPKNAQQVTSYCFNIGVPLYQTYVKHRIPDKLNELTTWYKSIRDVYKRLTTEKLINMTE